MLPSPLTLAKVSLVYYRPDYGYNLRGFASKETPRAGLHLISMPILYNILPMQPHTHACIHLSQLAWSGGSSMVADNQHLSCRRVPLYYY